MTADGGKLPPMVIFKRETIPKEKFSKGIIVKANEKGWINQEIMQIWFNEVWKKRKNVFFEPKSLLIYDSANAHLTPKVKKLVNSYSHLAVIPGRLTKKLQPLDISVNKSFKSKIRYQWEQWMMNGYHSFTKSGNMKRASYSEICNWIMKSWEEISPNCIKNGFKKAMIEEYDDLQNSDSSDISNDEEVEDITDGIPNSFVQLLDSMTVESDEDEDFEGFE